MTINTQITFKQYRNLLFRLAYKKPLMKVVLAVALTMIIWISGYYLHFLRVPEPKFYQYITLFLITIMQPSAIYWTIWQNFHSSTYLGEQLEIDITPETIKIKAETVYMEIKWTNIFKIDEMRSCFLIYQNSLSAIIIPKKDVPSSKHEELRNMLRLIPDVPAHVKKI